VVTPSHRHPNRTGSLARHDEAPWACPGRVFISLATSSDENTSLAPTGTDRTSRATLCWRSRVTLGGVAVPARSSSIVPVAVAIFALGVVALAAVFALFMSGHHDLPLWLNSSAGVLVPLGLALALFGLVREARARR
jgi:hypothetical protein